MLVLFERETATVAVEAMERLEAVPSAEVRRTVERTVEVDDDRVRGDDTLDVLADSSPLPDCAAVTFMLSTCRTAPVAGSTVSRLAIAPTLPTIASPGAAPATAEKVTGRVAGAFAVPA